MENGITTRSALSPEKLSEELRALASEAERLAEAQGKDLAEKTREIRERLSTALETVQTTAEDLEAQAAAGLKAADRTIREHPYQSIGIAVGLGLILGLILRRR